MAKAGFLLQSEHKLELDVDPGGTPTLEILGAGISSMDPDVNDELAQDKYLDGQGFGETDVVASQLILSFSGHRKYGDAVQDFIYGTLLTPGTGRRTNLEWTLPSGEKYVGPVTIANISGPSGDAGAKGDISFELHFNGKPTHTPAV